MGTSAKKTVMPIAHFFRKYLPFIGVGIVCLVFSFPFWGQGKIPFPTTYLVSAFPPWAGTVGTPVKNAAMPDIISQIYPWKLFTVDSWKHGFVPLWNPLSFAGTPHAGNYQSAVFAPQNILFFLFSFPVAWSIQILLQPLAAGIFMLLLFRVLKVPKTASLFGALSWMFCGFLTCWMGYGTLGWAALVLPLVFWGITGWMERSNVYAWMSIVAGTCWSLVSGHFQISLYGIIASVCFAFLLGFGRKKQGKILGSLTAIGLGVGLAAPQILLTVDAFVQSVRGSQTFRSEIIPFSYLLTIFAPDVFGNPVTRNDWFGHYAEWATYIGVIPLAFALYPYSIFGKKFRLAAWIGIIAILAMATPTPINGLLYKLSVPVLSGSAASRIVYLASFLLVLLSTGSVGYLVGNTKSRKIPVLLWAGGIGLFLLVVWAIFILGKPVPVQYLTVARRNLVLPTALALCAAAGGVLAGFLPKIRWIKTGIFWMLVALTAFDMLRFAGKWMPFEDRQYLYPGVSSAEYLSSIVKYDRVFGNFGGEASFRFQLPSIEGYDAMYKGRFGEFIQAASTGTVSEPPRSVVLLDKHGMYTKDVLALLGVRYIYHKNSDARAPWAFPYWEYPEEDRTPLFHDDAYTVIELKNTYPRAFLASSYRIETDKQAIITALFSKTTNRRETVILEQKPDIEPMSGSASAEIVTYSGNTVRIRTSASVPKLLFLSDAYDAGWSADIDGKPTKVLRADYAFRAIAVPEGIHTVTFSYRPVVFSYGVIASVVSLLCSISFVVWKRRNP